MLSIKNLLAVLLIWPVFASSQSLKIIPVDSLGNPISYEAEKDWWMSSDHIRRMEAIRVTYTKPANFIEVLRGECFQDNPKLELMLTCVGNPLQSEDTEFITFLAPLLFSTKSDSASLRQSFPGMSIPNLNEQHIYKIRSQILRFLGKDATVRGPNAGFDWKPYVNYYPEDEAAKRFNADTAITYVVELNDDELYKGKYRYLKALFLQKRDRGFVVLYSFYTDKAKRHPAKYWKAIERIYRYDD